MTNEKAREILNILKEYERAYQYSKEEVVGALDMAIKALEQQTAEDCVKRDDAIRLAEQGQIQGFEWQFKQLAMLPSVQPQPKSEDMGEVSDGYHTFNQLYHQRAILFATIVNQNKDRAWKSYKHEDGKYCFDKDGEWFIVGIDTPLGSYTYHYSKEYWDYFDCEELECGKPWDGHTEEDVTRLLSLLSVTPQPKRGKWEVIRKEYEFMGGIVNEPQGCKCSNCGGIVKFKSDFCPSCGSYNGGEKG